MATTTAVRVHKFGASHVLAFDTIPLPEPKDDEFIVKVLAASVNPVDFKIRNGTYSRVRAEDLPRALGRDLSGIVEAVGPAAPFKVGDAVYAFIGSERGGYSGRVLVKSNEAAAKPRSLSHVEAAAVPLAGLTAWQGLFLLGGLQAGQRVLIHSGNGGVGHLAVQFAKAKGAWVATTVSGLDMEFVRGLGADQVIDYRAQKFEDEVEPVDLVLDLVGGEICERSFRAIKPGGCLVSALGPPSKEMADKAGVRTASFIARVNAEQLAEIGQLIDAGTVKVKIQETFAIKDVAKAHDRLEHTHTCGKIVLDLTK